MSENKNNKKKVLLLNTLLLVFCCVVIYLFIWEPETVIQKFDVNFDSNGGTAVAAIEIDDGECISRPEDPTREGYIFVGWELDGVPYDFNECITSDITLEAVWQEIEEGVTYYTIAFDSGSNGSYVASQVIAEGDIPTKPEDPTREGYEFKGWLLNGAEYNFDTPIDSNSTLVASWEEKDKEINISVKVGEDYTLTSNDLVQKESDNFDEIMKGSWSSSASTVAAIKDGVITGVNEGKATITVTYGDNKTKTIVVTVNKEDSDEDDDDYDDNSNTKKYTVSFMGNGGTTSGCSRLTVSEGSIAKPSSSCKATRVSEKSNKSTVRTTTTYTFKGWATTTDATSPNISSTKITKDTNFYAVWKKTTTYSYPVTLTVIDTKANINFTCTAWYNSGTNVTVSRILTDGSCKAPTKSHSTLNWTKTSLTVSSGDNNISGSFEENEFKVGCTPGDNKNMSANSCALYITEEGKTLSGVTIRINGRQVNGMISITSQWNSLKPEDVSFTLSDDYSSKPISKIS